jgi:hypothetical protein
MSTELPKYLTVDGKQFDVESFSDGVKKLLVIYQQWEQETVKSRLEVAKNEAALRDLTREIQAAVAKEVTAPAVDDNEMVEVNAEEAELVEE